jgi:hypothetical protein
MCTVLIWENNIIDTGHTWIGHAAMKIGGNWTGPNVDDDDYVSWWPDGPSGKKEEADADPNKHLVTDILSEGYLPDHIIEINTTPNQELVMKAAWIAIRDKPNAHYKMLRKNCSTIVARVLRAGGYSAGTYAGLWYDHCLVWMPHNVKDFALAAGGVLASWANLKQQLAQVGMTDANITTQRYGVAKARDRRFCSTGAACRF